MSKKITLYIFCLLAGILPYSCDNRKNEPSKNVVLRQPFTAGYAVYYGAYYDYLGIDTHVFELDLYTEGLGIDSTGQYVGSGQNLYMTDIFSLGNDSLLAEGIYSIDTLYQYTPGSILGGESYGGIPGGAQLINVSSTGISYDYIKSGTMEVKYRNDSVLIAFKLQTQQGTQIENQCNSKLPQFNMSKTEGAKQEQTRKLTSYKSTKNKQKICFIAENRL